MNPSHRAGSAGAAVLAITLLLAAVPACATPDIHGTPGGQRPSPPSDGSQSAGAPGQGLTETASAIDAYLREAYPGQYAGLELDQAHGALVVYRRDSPELDAALRRKFARAPVELRQAPYAARDLDALAQRISDDIAYWERRGIPITTIAARVDGTAVEVGTVDVREATAELPRRYGTAIPIEIIESHPVFPTTSP